MKQFNIKRQINIQVISEKTTFIRDLVNAVSNAAVKFKGGYYSNGVFYTNSFKHASTVAYQVPNAIVEDSKSKNYLYQIVKK